MISLNLRPIFKACNIKSPYSFLVKAELSSIAALDIYPLDNRIYVDDSLI